MTGLICETRDESAKPVYYLAGKRKQLNETERAEIGVYIAEAETYLIPAIRDSRAGQRQAVDALTRLFLTYPAASSSEATVEARVAVFLEVLSDLPAHAISEAVSKWLKGEAGEYDYKWAPVPPILRQIALGVLSPARQRAYDLRKLLAAADHKPATPVEGERERVHAGFKSLSESLGNVVQAENEKNRQRSTAFTKYANQKAFERECEANGVSKDSIISPSLANLIAEQNKRI